MNSPPRAIVVRSRGLLFFLCALTMALWSGTVGAQDLERQRERWSEMPEAQREVLRRRYELLKQMSPEERASLEERSRRWKNLEPYLRRTMPRDHRERLDGLGGRGAREAWMEAARDHMRDNGRSLRAALPEHVREELKGASVEELRAYMRGVHERREFHGDRALFHLGRRLGYSRREIEEFRSRSIEQKLELVLQLRRRVIEEEVDARFERGSQPPGLSQEQWAELKAASDDRFFRTMRKFRPPHPGPPRRAMRRGPHSALPQGIRGRKTRRAGPPQ